MGLRSPKNYLLQQKNILEAKKMWRRYTLKVHAVELQRDNIPLITHFVEFIVVVGSDVTHGRPSSVAASTCLPAYLQRGKLLILTIKILVLHVHELFCKRKNLASLREEEDFFSRNITDRRENQETEKKPIAGAITIIIFYAIFSL